MGCAQLRATLPSDAAASAHAGRGTAGRCRAGIPPALARWYLRRLGTARRVLDAGCGTGALARAAGGQIEFHGLDSDPAAVALAGRYGQAAVWDLESGPLPFTSAFFDAVVAKDVIEHVDRPLELLLEFRRVLRPGGILLASVPMAKPRAVWDDYTHVRGFTRNALAYLTQDAGFRVSGVRRMGPLPLASRLGLIALVPLLLRLPGLSYFARSWEICAARAAEVPDV